MKIEIFKEGKPIYVFHHPRDVRYDKKHNTITIGSTDPMTFHLLREPVVDFVSCANDEFSEIHVTFEIKDSDFKDGWTSF